VNKQLRGLVLKVFFLIAKGDKHHNRQASSEIIAELERQSRGISFDSEPVFRNTPE